MSEYQGPENARPIDAVVTWVDGNDPEFLKRMEPFLRGKSRSEIPGAHPTRFATINEIRYCVFSILRFAPFIRKIFIITAGQYPNLYEDIKKYFPERANSIKIVDHSEIFRGFEQYLPTFNSRTIETMMWRIEGLSERFVYFNDDMFLIRPIAPDDWFVSDRPVLRGRWLAAPWLRIFCDKIRIVFHRNCRNMKNYQPRPSFHLGQWLAAFELGFRRRYFFFSHAPYAVNRKTVENFFRQNPSLLEKNISHRFKYHAQFNFVALANHLEILAGNKFMTNPHLIYMQPYKRPENYVDKKFMAYEKDPKVKFLCVQSLEMCSEKTQRKVFAKLDQILGLV